MQLDEKSLLNCAKLQVKQSHGEIGHNLQSKPAKDSSLRFVALCGEVHDPLDEEGGQVPLARREESAYITATQGHSNPHLDITTFSHNKSQKSYAQRLFDLGNSSNEDLIKSGGILPGGLDEETKRQTCYFSLASASDKSPDPKYMTYNSLKRHHDRIYVFDLPLAQELIVFFLKRQLCYHTVLAQFLMSRVQTKERKTSVHVWNVPLVMREALFWGARMLSREPSFISFSGS